MRENSNYWFFRYFRAKIRMIFFFQLARKLKNLNKFIVIRRENSNFFTKLRGCFQNKGWQYFCLFWNISSKFRISEKNWFIGNFCFAPMCNVRMITMWNLLTNWFIQWISWLCQDRWQSDCKLLYTKQIVVHLELLEFKLQFEIFGVALLPIW